MWYQKRCWRGRVSGKRASGHDRGESSAAVHSPVDSSLIGLFPLARFVTWQHVVHAAAAVLRDIKAAIGIVGTTA